MNILRLIACLVTLATPLLAHSQFSTYRVMPSVARPAPGEPGCKKPEYPLSARRDGDQGTVTFRYLIDKDGAILSGKIVKSSGSFELDKAAFVAYAKCQYKVREGIEEPTWVTLQHVWVLE